jgi:hypothetical protein
MCFSEEQSKKSLLFNTITCYILYTYYNSSDTRILALFFKFVGLMQLFDLIFWRNQNIQDPTESVINYTTTKIAMLANHLQPIVLGLLIYIFTGSLGELSKIMLAIYTITITYYTICIWNKINYTLSMTDSSVRQDTLSMTDSSVTSTSNDISNSLKWDWNLQKSNLQVYFIFLLTLSVLAYENFDYPINIILLFINLITFLLSAYYFKSQFIGRFWCKFASFVPIIFILFKT